MKSNQANISLDLEKKLLNKTLDDHEIIKARKENSIFSHVKTNFEQFQGLIFALVSAIFVSMSTTLNKKAEIFSGSEQAAVRYTLQLFIMIIIARYNDFNIFGIKEHRKLLTLRGCFGFLGLMSLYFSVKLINPSDATAISNTKLVILAILARIFLKERFTTMNLFSLFFTIAGILLISQPSFLINSFIKYNLTAQIVNHDNSTVHLDYSGLNLDLKKYIGISLALFSALASSFVSILIKKLTNIKAHFSILIIYSAYVGLPTSLIISLVMHLMNTTGNRQNKIVYAINEISWQIFYSISSALTGIVGQVLLTTSFKHEDATKIAILRSTNLFWAFLLQYMFLGIKANMYSFIGVVLIFTAILFSIIAKIAEKKTSLKISQAENRKKSNCSIVERVLFYDF